MMPRPRRSDLAEATVRAFLAALGPSSTPPPTARLADYPGPRVVTRPVRFSDAEAEAIARLAARYDAEGMT